MPAQYLIAADDDDDRHRNAGQDIDQRRHHLLHPGGAALGLKILPRPLFAKFEIYRFAARFLHGAHAIDVFRERAILR